MDGLKYINLTFLSRMQVLSFCQIQFQKRSHVHQKLDPPHFLQKVT